MTAVVSPAALVAQASYDGTEVDVRAALESSDPTVRWKAEKAAAALIDLCQAKQAAAEVAALEEKLAAARARLNELAQHPVHVATVPADTPAPAVPAARDAEPNPTEQPASPPASAHTCADCGVEFKSSQALGAHRSAKHPPAPVRCNDCGRIFATNAGLGGHRRSCVGRAPATPAPVEAAENIPADIPAADPIAGEGSDLEIDGLNAVVERAAEFVPLGDVKTQVHERMEVAGYRPGPHPMVAMCGCGHTQRRHEDHEGICLAGDCGCAGYEAAAA